MDTWSAIACGISIALTIPLEFIAAGALKGWCAMDLYRLP